MEQVPNYVCTHQFWLISLCTHTKTFALHTPDVYTIKNYNLYTFGNSVARWFVFTCAHCYNKLTKIYKNKFVFVVVHNKFMTMDDVVVVVV